MVFIAGLGGPMFQTFNFDLFSAPLWVHQLAEDVQFSVEDGVESFTIFWTRFWEAFNKLLEDLSSLLMDPLPDTA